MRIFVRAKPGAKTASIRKIEKPVGLFENKDRAKKEKSPQFIVSIKERAVDGAANAAIVKAVAEYFDVAPSRVRIVFGHTSREKVLEIED